MWLSLIVVAMTLPLQEAPKELQGPLENIVQRIDTRLEEFKTKQLEVESVTKLNDRNLRDVLSKLSRRDEEDTKRHADTMDYLKRLVNKDKDDPVVLFPRLKEMLDQHEFKFGQRINRLYWLFMLCVGVYIFDRTGLFNLIKRIIAPESKSKS